MSAYGIRDALHWWVYDTVKVVGGHARLFEVPEHQADSVSLFGPGMKSRAETNMDLSGQIPAGWILVVSRIVFEPVAEWPLAAMSATLLRLIIGSKTFVEIPAVWAFPVRGMSSEASGYQLGRPLALHGSERFMVELQGPSDAPDRVARVSLGPELGRPVQ